jgi:hypothetical protein
VAPLISDTQLVTILSVIEPGTLDNIAKELKGLYHFSHACALRVSDNASALAPSKANPRVTPSRPEESRRQAFPALARPPPSLAAGIQTPLSPIDFITTSTIVKLRFSETPRLFV